MKLTLKERQIASMLADCGALEDGCHKCNAYFADKLRISREEVADILLELLKKKLISVKRIIDENGFERRTIMLGGDYEKYGI